MPEQSTISTAADRWAPSTKLLTVAVVWTLLMTACALVGTSRASASVGSPGVDWWAASQLPPIESSAPGGPTLTRDDVADIVCIADATCVASTVRPVLEADVDPDADGQYRFVVFDLSGAGGTVNVAAEHVGTDPEWSPRAGLLAHGHTYAWTVHGDPAQTQDWAQFVVDVQRATDQPLDEVGPLSVGLGSGALFVRTEVAATADGQLGLAYTAPGPSTPSMLPAGWSIGGEAMSHISYVGVESFADDSTVVVHGIDGTSIRYDRDDTDGRYRPPAAGGQDLSFLFPELLRTGVGWTLVDTAGTTSTFAADGNLMRVEANAPDGTTHSDVDVVVNRGRLVSITDAATGQAVTFTYVGDRGYRPPPGFDRGSAEPRLGSITGVDGTVTNLAYVDGRLARIETAGATLDLAYDQGGRLAEIREPIAADAHAAGVRPDDASIHWRIGYDQHGRVAKVTSPEPTPGAAPLVRSYEYGPGTTTAFAHGEDGPLEAVTVTFDHNDLRPLSQAVAGRAPLRYLYTDDGALLGSVDPTGLQTTYVQDADASTAIIYGPAPAGWFDSDGTPLPDYADQVGSSTYLTGAGAGMAASFYDSAELGTPAVAMRLLSDGTVTAPGVIDVASGWRVTATGDPRVEAGHSFFRVTADGSDTEASSLVVNGVRCDLGEACEVEVEVEVAETARVLLAVDARVPAGQRSVELEIEHSADGQTWHTVGFDTLTGHDLPVSESYTDVYRAGDAPVVTVEDTEYADVSTGSVGAYLRDGQPVVHLGYEAANPAADQWGRATSITRPSGLTTAITYWGSQEYVAHPLTNDLLLQAGARKDVQVGDGIVYTAVYDNTGRPIATLADGELVEAIVLDERGRIERLHMPAAGGAPARENAVVYGADGDPLRTDIAIAIGDDQYVASETVDLLGRPVSTLDVWGVTTEMTYDQLGNHTSTRTTAPDGITTTSTQSWDAQGLVEHHVVAADGTSLVASVTGRDAAGRTTEIVYSNGTTLERSYDPVTGAAESTYTDANGDTWTETLTTTSQTGRILGHELHGPGAGATFTYGYDPTSGALATAALSVTGSHPLEASWTYLPAYADDACPATSSEVILDGARAQTVATIDGTTTTTTLCYDADGAPTRRIESGAAVEQTPINVIDGNIVSYGALELAYDVNNQLVLASDADTTIELLRTADATIIEQRTTGSDGEAGVVRYASAGLMLDEHNVAVTQTISLPGDVTATIPIAAVDGMDTTWAYATVSGDVWFRTDAAGVPTSPLPSLYNPDGEPIALDDAHDSSYGWKAGHNGEALELDTDVVIFGARTYIPELASFTTPDPQAHGGSTQYNYANGDPINLVDPTGLAPDWLKSFTDWLDNLPLWAEIAMVVVIALVALIPGVGPAFAAVLTMVMAGYYLYKAITSFANGEYFLGFVYLVEVVVMITAFWFLARLVVQGKSIVTTKKVLVQKGQVVPQKHGAAQQPMRLTSKKATMRADKLGTVSEGKVMNFYRREWSFNHDYWPFMVGLLGSKSMTMIGHGLAGPR